MIRTVLALVVLAVGWSLASPAYTADPHGAAIALFPSEIKAQQHCPGDTVVWLNTPTSIYHFKGERWYGRTKHGAFVCEREADEAGDRATRNGQ
jgi:hypothetical protein